MVTVNVVSSEIARAELRCSLNTWTHIYAFPFLCFYPLLAYAYYIKYDDWLKSEEWTFLACVTLGAGHALSFLVTRWNAGAKAWITTTSVRFSLPFPLYSAGYLVEGKHDRPVRWKKQTASASSHTPTAAKAKSSPSKKSNPPTHPPTNSATNKTPTQSTPSPP